MASNKVSNNDDDDNNNAEISLQQQQHHHQQPIQHNHELYHQQNSQMLSFAAMMQSASSIPGSFNINKYGGAYDSGELDQALFLYYLNGGQDQSAQEHRNNSGMRPQELNIFPSQPMHVEPSETASKGNSSGMVSSPAATSGSKRSSEEQSMDLSNNSRNNVVASASEPAKVVLKRDGNRKGPTSSSEQRGSDSKTERRLAQNREAARKSRLRKKAYVQQLESSRMRLTQLEQEIQKARSQGFNFLEGNASLAGDQNLNISSSAAVFDVEYARWLEEQHRLSLELRNALHNHLPENELGSYLDKCLAHFGQIISLKTVVAKSDVFHLFSGMWKTPAERFFMWMGGFRPSELIKVIIGQIEPLTEQQVVGIYGLQRSTQEAEEALSQGLDSLNHAISEAIVCDSLIVPPIMPNFMNQMVTALDKLTALERFVRQGDHLRHQTLIRLHHILTTRQAARCFVAMDEYFYRLRNLSSIWARRPRGQE